MPSFPDAQAFQIMEEDLGRPIAAVFSSISEHPIAAASLGQVRLAYAWRPVHITLAITVGSTSFLHS